MAASSFSRDGIAMKVFGRKFSSLSLESKQWVNKTMSVLYSAGRQGHDVGYMLSTAAMNETAKIVKQLKEIAVNPGDVIELPKGVLADAARVIHYQSKAVGRGRVLDPKDLDQIKKDIKKQFGTVDPRIVTGITDYLTNTTGRFSGVGPRTLRGKLGSFLTKDELGTISNGEIVAARDIVIAHLFDKWSGGNLSSFVKPRLEDVLEDQRKGLRGLKPAPKDINRAELEDTIRALEIIKHANSNLNYANRADFRFACKNLGIDFSKIVSPQARGHSANVMHKFAQASSREKFGRAHWDDARSIPKFRMGSGLRFNRRTHRSPVEIKSVYGTGNLATTIRENAARLASDIPSVDMYEYHGTPAEEHWGLDERVDFGALAEDAIESVQEIKEAALEATWKRIEKKGFPETEFVPMGRSAQNVAKMLGYTGETISRSGEATFRSTRTPTGWIIKKWASSPIDVHGKIAPAYRDTTLFRSSHIEPRIVSGTDARSLSRLHEAVGIEEENMDIAVLNEIDEYVDRYGKHGKALYEAWVPLHSDDPQYGKLVTWLLTHKGREAYWAREQLIEKFGSTFPRFEREIKEDTSEKKATGGYRAMEFVDSQFDAVSRLFDAESHHTQKFIGAAEKFREYFNGPSGDIVNLPKHMELYRELAGLGAVKGVKRVGVVGSKSWDNEPFMRKYLNKNFDREDILVSATAVGKGIDSSSFGAGYQAGNWAYWEDIMHHPITPRVETRTKGKKTFKQDFTMKDVIDSSDKIIAFFDELSLSSSGGKQLNALFKYIGDKPCRIIWVPTKLTNTWDKEHGMAPSKGLLSESVKSWIDHFENIDYPHNITFEMYNPGGLPTSLLDATSMESAPRDDKRGYTHPIGPLRGFKLLDRRGISKILADKSLTDEDRADILHDMKIDSIRSLLELAPDERDTEKSRAFRALFAKSILGNANERLGVFQPGMIRGFFSEGDAGSAVFTQDQIENAYRAVGIHNHPSGDYYLSDADIKAAIRAGLHKIVAVSKTGDFSSLTLTEEVYDAIRGFSHGSGCNLNFANGSAFTDNLIGNIRLAEERAEQEAGRFTGASRAAALQRARFVAIRDALESIGLPRSLYNVGNINDPEAIKFLANGGPLKSNEMAIVGEAGPELLVPTGGGAFNVIPNKALRYLAEGTLPLASYARNVTGEKQPDEHDYIDPLTGEIWPSVTKIKNLGKAYNGGAYYGHVGSVAHYYAAKAMGEKHGIDTSHVAFPSVEGSPDLKGQWHSAEDIIANGKAISEQFLKLADELGFVPTLIEQRFVNTRDKYSGTLDIAGFIRDELGNLVPTIADFKSSSNVDKDFAEQIAAYADFFEDSVKGFVINVSRDLSKMGNYEMDLVSGYAGWQKKLQKYNETYGPRPVSGGPSNAEDDAAMRLFNMANQQVSIYDVATGERYNRQGIGVTTPGHAKALSKAFPKFEAVGATPDETWDKNPSRLDVYTARINELYGATGGIHPIIKEHMSTLEKEGWNNESLTMLAHAPIGSVEDDQATIKMFDQIYQQLKPIGFNQNLLSSGKNLDSTLWHDAITLLNILEEAGKSFESVPRFANKRKSSPIIPTTVPGPDLPGVSSAAPAGLQKGSGEWLLPTSHPLGIPESTIETDAKVSTSKSKSKCPGVDLCEPTMSRFAGWFGALKVVGATTSGGSGGSRTSGGREQSDEDAFREKYLRPELIEHPKGWQKILEKIPIIGLPAQMKRKEQQYGELVMEAERTGDYEKAPRGYWKLLEKEDQARKGYLRSIRGATTSFLIAQHVMRVFGQTSKVYNKAHESVGKGFGYMIDMFLMPIIPFIKPVVGFFVAIGNGIRALNALFPPLALLGVPIVYKIIKGTYEWIKLIGGLPAIVNRASEALDKLVGVLDRAFPIPEEIKNLHLNEERGLVPYTETAEAYPGRMMHQSRMLPPGKTYETDFYAPESGPASGKSGKYDIIPGVNWTFGGPGVRPAEKKRPVPKGFLGDIPYYSKGGVVPGTGTTDSVLAMLTPGEVVISKNDLPHYADGGIAGGVVGNVLGLYGNIMSTDIAQSIVGGLGVVSKSVGAMMAPLAPAFAVGALAGRGWQAVKNSIDRGTKITTMVSEGGFGALRTLASAQLIGLLTGLGPLLPIAGAILGVYAWVQGFGVIVEGVLRGIKSVLDMSKGVIQGIKSVFDKFQDAFKSFVDWIKSIFDKRDEKKSTVPKLSSEKLLDAERNRRKSAKDKYREMFPDEEKKAEEESKNKKKGFWERVTDKFPLLKGVPGMAALGGLIGAAESKEPIDWAKSGILGGAAQLAFNVGERVVSKIPGVGKYAGGIMGGVGGFLAPDFGEHIGKAFVSGEGPLGIGKYLGLQGNRTAERAVSMIATQLMTGTSIVGNIGAGISDVIGGTDLKGGILQQILGGNSKISGDYSAMGELYEFGYNNPKVAPMASMLPGGTIMLGGSQMAALVQIANDISKLVDNTKQPTINNNHIEMSNSDPFALFQQFVQWLGTEANTRGAQGSI